VRVDVETGEPGGRERKSVDDARPDAALLSAFGDGQRRGLVAAPCGAVEDENLFSRHGKPLSLPAS
jgi:hypothetical protein